MESSPARVLVVDDNQALRENLVEALELEGYDVAAAVNGLAALEQLASGPPPAVVLVDFRMPGMTGADLVARIREDPRLAGVRVVMATGSVDARSLAQTSDAVLMKPFGVRELLAALRKVGVQAPSGAR